MRRIFFILFCILLISPGNAIQYEYYNRNAQYNAAHKYGGQVGVLSPGTSQGFGVLSALTNLEEVDSGLASGQKAINVATLNQKAPTEAAVSSYVTNIVNSLQSQLDGKQATVADLATIRSGAAAGSTAVQPNDLATVATSGNYSDLAGTPTIGNGAVAITVNGQLIDSFTVNATNNRVINIPLNSSTVGAIDDDLLQDIVGNVDFFLDPKTYELIITTRDIKGEPIGKPQVIDLPLETMVVNASYQDNGKKLILELQNGSTVEVPVSGIISGLQPAINITHKLASDLIDDSSSSKKMVTTSEKTTWNNKLDTVATANKVYGTDANGAQTVYDKNSFGQVDDVRIGANSIVSNKIATLGTAASAATTDFATAAQGVKANTAVQPGDNVSDLTNDAGYLAATIATTLSAGSTNTTVPGTLATYNFASNAENLTSGNLAYARISSLIGTSSNKIAAGNDSRFNTVPTSQPSGSAGTGRAFIWIQ